MLPVLRLWCVASLGLVTLAISGVDEFRELVDFVRNGLLDSGAKPENLRKLVPASVPSGRPTLNFQFQQTNTTSGKRST